MRNASAVEVEPIFSSLSSIKKIGEILICSLWRKFVEMASISETVFYTLRGRSVPAGKVSRVSGRTSRNHAEIIAIVWS